MSDNENFSYEKYVVSSEPIKVKEEEVSGKFSYGIGARLVSPRDLPKSAHKVISPTSLVSLCGQPRDKVVKALYDKMRSDHKELRERKLFDKAEQLLDKYRDNKQLENAIDYLVAKYHGDNFAALKTVNRVIKADTIRELAKLLDFNRRVWIIPITSMESNKINRLPIAYAKFLVKGLRELGCKEVDYSNDVLKIAGGHNTNKSRFERLNNTSTFVGDVDKDSQIVLVDDVWTFGNTMMSLVDHISKTHPLCNIVAIMMLTTSRYGKDVVPTEDLFKKAEEKTGLSLEEINQVLHYDFTNKVTGSELASYVRNFSAKSGESGLVEFFGC